MRANDELALRRNKNRVITEQSDAGKSVITFSYHRNVYILYFSDNFMSRIARRKVKGKTYFYLEESIKQGRKWVKESVYLGATMPSSDELRGIYLKFSRKLKLKGVRGVAPPFTEFITKHTAELLEDSIRTKSRFLKSLTPEKKAEFIKRERITFITDSNAIEGSTLDYNLTERVLKDEKRIERLEKSGMVITGMGREEQEALNLDKCLQMYEKYLAHKEDINEEMILRLHLVLLSKIEGYEKYGGIWRPVNVMIRGSSHVFPHYSEVFGLMHELLGWYMVNRGLIHPLELAAKFHTKFTSIHPFADGNGRMARLLMNYILQTNYFPFTNIPLRQRSSYMRTQEAGNHDDHKPFTLFLAKEVVKQCRQLKSSFVSSKKMRKK